MPAAPTEHAVDSVRRRRSSAMPDRRRSRTGSGRRSTSPRERSRQHAGGPQQITLQLTRIARCPTRRSTRHHRAASHIWPGDCRSICHHHRDAVPPDQIGDHGLSHAGCAGARIRRMPEPSGARNTRAGRSRTSSGSRSISGSGWRTVGDAIARITRGAVKLGPGPSRNRSVSGSRLMQRFPRIAPALRAASGRSTRAAAAAAGAADRRRTRACSTRP